MFHLKHFHLNTEIKEPPNQIFTVLMKTRNIIQGRSFPTSSNEGGFNCWKRQGSTNSAVLALKKRHGGRRQVGRTKVGTCRYDLYSRFAESG